MIELADPETRLPLPAFEPVERRLRPLMPNLDYGPEHTHLHRGVDGPLSFSHSHPWPTEAGSPNATRRHRHSNGEHSHPHGHAEYFR